MLSTGQMVDRACTLLASLPIATLNSTVRNRLQANLVGIDYDGDIFLQAKVRRLLASLSGLALHRVSDRNPSRILAHWPVTKTVS